MIARDDVELAAKKERYPDFGGIVGTPQAVLDQIQAYAAVGSQYMTFFLPDPQDIAALDLLGERVVPHLDGF
jgi:alkanesulfonate monooxygenase SsuD/methylene tetrahydromethanopterin reductase-like flavin-dependent oxidoreductase (luciferase family)